ncbi:FUSC family protein [Microbacterium sp. H1-D42]|uniref:FUSC family protein n=1 Tax=Microbacterium sp. H1-D42 TaxID=2925844 RepID=UPI001F52D4C1|nr:FUSC family protein [Microbacterium sp. H1-D42]UNK71312.1 hypothetical protein MNR00_02325 [Microbacterium sp. H1-D42]
MKTRRKTMMLAAKLLVALVVVAAPALITASFVPGVSAVAFYGVLAATFGWMSGGPRVAAAVVVGLTVFGSISILLRDQIWALALILVLLGVGYGYAASRGIGKAVLQLPILVPYFMHSPPALFRDPPAIGPQYFLWLAVIMLVMGAWTILILRVAGGERHLSPVEAPAPRVAIAYGTILGIISSAVMVVGTTTELETHWVWVTLTLYVLADPQHLFTPAKMVGRVSGTLAGFIVVSLLTLMPLPELVVEIIALLALWMCAVFMLLNRPYWQYAFFLTVAVVLMDTSDVDTLLLDTERFGFTIFGAALSILTALVVNLIAYRRVALTAPDQVMR